MLKVGLLQRALGLVQIMILSRVLEPKGLGAFTFVQSTTNTFAGMTRLGWLLTDGWGVGVSRTATPGPLK